uniref:Group II intron maturase-specific domain-containing protein n=1 Tax=Caulerpa lentillifera TaxID=148947 RepID=A0A7D4ZF92_9CHLO|nr:hypothetical protein [Caulerpa lentillifera]
MSNLQFFHRLLKFQKKINKKKSEVRDCRNFQRLFIRSRSIKFLIIGNLLSRHSLAFNFNNTEKLIIDQQWLLVLSALMSSKIVFLTGQKNYYIYNNLYKLKKKIGRLRGSVIVTFFDNFFSQKNKLWILSNLLVEKKFILSRIPSFQKRNIQKRNLKTIIQHLCIKDLFFLMQGTFGLEYNNFVIRGFSEKFANQVQDKILYNFALTRGLNIKFNKTYPSHKIHFLGGFLNGKMSLVNIRSHQKEFQKFLKMSSFPVDKIILELNKKISIWRNFYNEPNLSKIMNDYFFWRIWYWLKKRHKNKGSKWLYEKYWNKSTSRKWILSSNHESLILLKK